MRVAAAEAGRQTDAFQELPNAAIDLGAARQAVHEQRLTDGVAHRASWIERRIRILKDDLHAAPQVTQL